MVGATLDSSFRWNDDRGEGLSLVTALREKLGSRGGTKDLVGVPEVGCSALEICAMGDGAMEQETILLSQADIHYLKGNRQFAGLALFNKSLAILAMVLLMMAMISVLVFAYDTYTNHALFPSQAQIAERSYLVYGAAILFFLIVIYRLKKDVLATFAGGKWAVWVDGPMVHVQGQAIDIDSILRIRLQKSGKMVLLMDGVDGGTIEIPLSGFLKFTPFTRESGAALAGKG